jgi:hypothetical protein
MFDRYACPVCEGDLRSHLPAVKKSPWYKFVARHILICPHCGGEIEKRFAGFDAAFGATLGAMLAGGGFVSVWRLGRVLLPLVAVIVGLRFLAGMIFSRYVRVKPKI